MTGRAVHDGTAATWLALLVCGVVWTSATEPASAPDDRRCAGRWVETDSRDAVSAGVRCRDPGSNEGALGAMNATRAVRGPARLLVGEPIELNRASATTLEVLPGIGPGRAAAIVRERCRAPFGRLADVRRVSGIGPRTVEGLRGWAIAGAQAPESCEASTLAP